MPADRAKVWAALNDPEILKRSIPGCQELDKTSDTEFTATAKVAAVPRHRKRKRACKVSPCRPFCFWCRK